MQVMVTVTVTRCLQINKACVTSDLHTKLFRCDPRARDWVTKDTAFIKYLHVEEALIPGIQFSLRETGDSLIEKAIHFNEDEKYTKSNGYF